jgi:hypothetical protein
MILEHCTALERLDEPRTPAYSRLEQALGGRLAGLLVKALGGLSRRGRVAA